MSRWNFITQLWASFPVSWLKPKQIPADIQHLWVIFSSISSTGSYGDADQSWRRAGRCSFWSYRSRNSRKSSSRGWSEKLAAVALPFPSEVISSLGPNEVIPLNSITCEVFPYSLFPPENRTPWPLSVPERLMSIERREEVTVFLPPIQTSTRFLPPLKGNAAAGIIPAQPVIVVDIFPRIIVSDLFLPDNHGITRAVLDYSGWQADVEGGDRHSPPNPQFSSRRAERSFSPAITPLTGSHFLPFRSPMPVILLPVPLNVNQP